MDSNCNAASSLSPPVRNFRSECSGCGSFAALTMFGERFFIHTEHVRLRFTTQIFTIPLLTLFF